MKRCSRPLIFAAAGLSACTTLPPAGEPSTSSTPPATVTQGDVSLALDRDRYAPGAQLRMTIRNHGARTFGFNPCPRIVERYDGSAWVAHPEPDRVCTLELWLLEPQSTRQATTDLPSTLAAGTYRIALIFSREDSAPANPAERQTVRAESAPFRVE